MDNQKSKKGLPIVERVEHHDLEDGQDLVLVGPQHLHGGLATPENVNNKKNSLTTTKQFPRFRVALRFNAYNT